MSSKSKYFSGISVAVGFAVALAAGTSPLQAAVGQVPAEASNNGVSGAASALVKLAADAPNLSQTHLVQLPAAQLSLDSAANDQSAEKALGASNDPETPQPITQPPIHGDGDDDGVPSSKKYNSLAALVDATSSDGNLSRELHCLAGAIYFEAKSESLDGQLAVGRVVIARKNSGRFASSYCGVVYQPMQFSFVRGGRMPQIDKSSRNWRNAVRIARIAQADAWDSGVEGALFFHARYVSPNWRLRRLGTVGQHVFYR